MFAPAAMRRLYPWSLACAVTGMLLVAMAVACCHVVVHPADHHDTSSCVVCGNLHSAILSPVEAGLAATLVLACLRPQSEARLTSRPSICHRGRGPPLHLIQIRCR